MKYTPCFIFYGDPASGKTWLSKRFEGQNVEVIDEFLCTDKNIEKLIKLISTETEEFDAPDFYIIITYSDEMLVEELAHKLKVVKGLLVSTCHFIAIREE